MQIMQLDKNVPKGAPPIDINALRYKITKECKFITEILNRLPPMKRPGSGGDEDAVDSSVSTDKAIINGLRTVTTRAQTIEELQERLNTMKAKKKQGYRELLAKKTLKSTLKKKRKADERNLKHKQIKLEKSQKNVLSDGTQLKPSKPVFNSEGKMVFSKFDFSELGSQKEDKKKKKESKDPRKILEKLKEKKENLKKLQNEGQVEKALVIKQKEAWDNVLKKAEGLKVKDDPELLKKTMKREEARKRKSAKKWASREHGKKKAMEDRVSKRNTNIQARKDLVKKQKKQKAIKKGRIIPGF